MRVFNPVAPHFYNRLTVRRASGTSGSASAARRPIRINCAAFVQTVRTRTPSPTDAVDGIANMRVIDAVYEKAQLPRRGT